MFIMAKMIVPLIKAGAPDSSNRKLKKKKVVKTHQFLLG